ncbi:MAG: hypothetical protein ABSF70_05045 [Terracidiphilus sp.]|jgi:hypothetical protein
MEPAMGGITVLFARWRDGERSAFDELVPLVYPQLRQMAATYIHQEMNPDVVQGTVWLYQRIHSGMLTDLAAV